ncbi:dolichyl-phosphate beta-glucosyltransferase [Anaeramoeba ignava]|uniref:Dolichyl-phosphate beta-glucosyltransferase n=1 Tax=Anaeramoeba ignava TaxID=1746090 RepID=A0A9Q0LEJ6_ANAIG|nr:dolichyl-phosphate beta-glucosyltransferase [Anaeramoeba ignava]
MISFIFQIILFFLIFLIFLAIFIILKEIFIQTKTQKLDSDEKQFNDPKNGKVYQFSSEMQIISANISLSILFPLEKKNENYGKTINIKNQEKGNEFTDNLVKKHSLEKIRVLNLNKKQRKEEMVHKGVLISRGDYILVVDPNQEYNHDLIQKFQSKMKEIEKGGFGVIFESIKISKQKLIEKIFYNIFSFFAIRSDKLKLDSQFYSRKAANQIFPNLHYEGYEMNFELLYIIKHANIHSELYEKIITSHLIENENENELKREIGEHSRFTIDNQKAKEMDQIKKFIPFDSIDLDNFYQSKKLGDLLKVLYTIFKVTILYSTGLWKINELPQYYIHKEEVNNFKK